MKTIIKRKDGNSFSGKGTRLSHERRDCTVIALAVGLDIPYETAHKYCKLAGRRDRDGFNLYNVLGFSKKHIEGKFTEYVGNPGKTIKTFVRENPIGTYIVSRSTHSFVIKDGKFINESAYLNYRIQYYFKVTDSIIANTKKLTSVDEKKLAEIEAKELKKVELRKLTLGKQLNVNKLTNVDGRAYLVGDKVSFKPHHSKDGVELIGIIYDFSTDHKDNHYAKILTDKGYKFKQIRSITLVKER